MVVCKSVCTKLPLLGKLCAKCPCCKKRADGVPGLQQVTPVEKKLTPRAAKYTSPATGDDQGSVKSEVELTVIKTEIPTEIPADEKEVTK